MTATTDDPIALPADVADAVTRYRTCELATVGKSGDTIAWPTVTSYDVEAGTFTITTSIGLPVKAFNIRREPRVAMLFSEPAGAGAALPQVLVRGLATCPDVVVADPSGQEDFWRRLYALQPAGKAYGANAVTRRLMDWYYFRLVITVTPTSFEVRPPLTTAAVQPSASATGRDDAAKVAREIRRYDSAVLSWRDKAGAPTSARVRPVGTDGSALLLAADEEPAAGPASLLCHGHDEKLWSLRSFAATGRVVPAGNGWQFRTTRYIPGATANPLAMLRMLRTSRATAARYLDKRGLDRPTPDWAAFKQLYATD